MYGCKSWTIKKAEHQRIDVFELWCWRRLLRVPWIAKEIKPVHPKGNQSWIFIGRTDAEIEAPLLCPPDVKNWLLENRPWCWEVLKQGGEGDRGWNGWMASLTWWTWVWASSEIGDGQGSLVCYSPRGHKELDTTEWLNWTELNIWESTLKAEN